MELIGRYQLGSRLHQRGGQPEYRFYYRHPRPRLPVLRDGVVTLARWGNGCGASRVLPRTGWTWKASVDAGHWARSGAVPVTIPANYGLERRGVWFGIRTGIQGLLVPDEHGFAVCYMICTEPTHYYRVMTGASWMPVLIDQVI